MRYKLLLRLSGYLGFLILSSIVTAQNLPSVRISVLNFVNASATDDLKWLSKAAADTCIETFLLDKNLAVIEREALLEIIAEQELVLTGLFDETKSPQTGKLIGASHLVYGSFTAQGSKIQCTARIIEAETGLVKASNTQEGTNDTALTMFSALARNLAKAMNWQVKPLEPQNIPVEAVKNYYQGLDLMDAGNFAGAVLAFQKANEQAPLYAAPGKGLETAYLKLKNFKLQRYHREMNLLLADISALRRRIEAERFYSFADMITKPGDFGFEDAAAASAAYQARPRVYAGATPMQAVWSLQNYLGELASLALDYFEDERLAKACGDEIIQIADLVAKTHAKDTWLPEVLYQKLLVLAFRDKPEATMELAELLMTKWPDYRMLWAVEDFYARALEALEEKN